MEDQFGGRTDDDLFYDDFEPVESETVLVDESSSQPPPAPSESTTVTAPPPPSEPKPKPKPAHQNATPKPVKTLAHSRFADKPAAPTSTTGPASASAPPAPTASQPSPAPEGGPGASPANPLATAAAATTAPKDKPHRPSTGVQGANTADAQARLQSGANPRQKLTDEELAAKMEKMKLLAAERTRKFEMAEKDEKQHAQAYARGMEEARKRRADEAERRRRGEEDRKRMEDERAKNRERKLKAMGAKEGGWDEGKEALAEEEARKGFRGANGGIRGARNSAGLGGSRFARQGEEHDVDRFLDERHPGGRGRGGRGGGRGGRGGRGGAHEASTPTKQLAQAVPTVEDFPALPSDGTKKEAKPRVNTAVAPAAAPKLESLPATPSLSLPPGGKWDDEMEALDALNQGKS